MSIFHDGSPYFCKLNVMVNVAGWLALLKGDGSLSTLPLQVDQVMSLNQASEVVA